MWQNIVVFLIIAVVGVLTVWRFSQKLTGKSSCCGGGCTCKGSCGGSGGGTNSKGSSQCASGRDAGAAPPGRGLPMSPSGCGCSR